MVLGGFQADRGWPQAGLTEPSDYDPHVAKSRCTARGPRNHGREPKRVNLSQFDSVEDALEKVEPGARYVDIGSLLLPLPDAGMPSTLASFFWMSMITRSEGLHQAIARECRCANPHAVFPLIRAFAEAFVLVFYVSDHPQYVRTLIVPERELRKDGPKRKKIKALIAYASKRAPGIDAVYRELSEATHFGSTAMWGPHRVDGKGVEGVRTSWSSGPRWRSDEETMIACAMALEIADAMEEVLREFTHRHVLPLRPAQSIDRARSVQR